MTTQAGARNMLLNCAKAQPGEHVLIAYERADLGYFDATVLPCVAQTARDLGLIVETLDVGFTPFVDGLTDTLSSHIDRNDIIVFLARLGDQVRFSDMPQDKRIVACFALDGGLLGSGFGTPDHRAMVALKDCVTDALSQAESVEVSCKSGTRFSGQPDMSAGDTTVLRFPMSVFKPVPAYNFSGRVALCGFLTGTGSRYYESYTVEFDGPVMAYLDEGRLTGFEGSHRDVAAANAQYDRVAGQFGLDRNCVHSWHAGLHPACGYVPDARDNHARWSGGAFGNPRILHFHTCGSHAPGEISWNVLDATILIDGVPVWQDGVFHADRLSGGQEILSRYRDAARVFANPDPQMGLEARGSRGAPVPGLMVLS